MSFVKDMFREFGFAFCISEVFPMFFKSCVEVSVGSSYITGDPGSNPGPGEKFSLKLLIYDLPDGYS